MASPRFTERAAASHIHDCFGRPLLSHFTGKSHLTGNMLSTSQEKVTSLETCYPLHKKKSPHWKHVIHFTGKIHIHWKHVIHFTGKIHLTVNM